MKTSDEMMNDLRERRDAYIATQTKKRKTVGKITLAGVACLLAVGIGFGVWRGTRAAIPVEPDEQPPVSAPPSAPVSDDGGKDAVVWAENWFCERYEESFTAWHQFDCVTYRLADALESEKCGDGTVFAILARPFCDYEFVFEGKTLAAYYAAKCDEQNLPDLLLQLLKDGESLKYGEALYTTGTPDGERWAKELYEERVAFYGQALLDKYIVNGEFLRERLEQDIPAAEKQTAATDAYTRALTAYLQSVAAKAGGSYPAKADASNNGIILYFTRAEFAAFAPDHAEAWTFDLATRNESTPSDMVASDENELYGEAE